MLALDVSGSMRAEDFKPENRLYVAREEIKRFVSKRASDRIGLVVFSQSSFTQCPLTLDYGVLLNFLDQVRFGMIKDGTAIGMALANCVNRLRESPSKSKVIVLLTDGVNNAGEIDPLTAAGIAKTMGVKIYTIGVGRPGNAMYPVDDPIFGKRYVYLPNEIDEDVLKEIAGKTGGKYFRARSEKELEQIYDEIDSLEKTKVKVNEYVQYEELFPSFVYFGLALLVLEMLLGQTIFRKIP
jgi:Ca-activated chloride channel family protein